VTLRWSTDVAQADWLVERIHGFGGVVSSIVPAFCTSPGIDTSADLDVMRGDRP